MDSYHHLQASMLRFAADFRDQMQALGYTLEVVNLDAFTNEEGWPNADFIGVHDFTVVINQLYEGSISFTLSTQADTNLYRLSKLMRHLAARLRPNNQIPIYDADTGVMIGSANILEGVTVGSPIPTKTQPVQPVMLEFVTDLRSF